MYFLNAESLYFCQLCMLFSPSFLPHLPQCPSLSVPLSSCPAQSPPAAGVPSPPSSLTPGPADVPLRGTPPGSVCVFVEKYDLGDSTAPVEKPDGHTTSCLTITLEFVTSLHVFLSVTQQLCATLSLSFRRPRSPLHLLLVLSSCTLLLFQQTLGQWWKNHERKAAKLIRQWNF